jgi:phospholipid/cholesterol/gamma-HCH transport system substrate-binding protein
MKRNHIETVLGAVVLIVAFIFFAFSYSAASVGNVSGYHIKARFNGLGGLGIGDSVQISGVKVGSVAKIELNPNDYRAMVTMAIDPKIQLPTDTSAFISSESLLGGKYMELQPGADDEMMKEGEEIMMTQSPQNLEQLLGKFIFSMDSEKGADTAADDAAAETP